MSGGYCYGAPLGGVRQHLGLPPQRKHDVERPRVPKVARQRGGVARHCSGAAAWQRPAVGVRVRTARLSPSGARARSVRIVAEHRHAVAAAAQRCDVLDVWPEHKVFARLEMPVLQPGWYVRRRVECCCKSGAVQVVFQRQRRARD